MKINHFSHERELTLFQKTEEKFKQVSEKVAKLYVGSDAEISSDSEGYEEDESTKLPKCNGCYETIQGPAYFCETCEDFWLHKSCASLSRELSDHPSHPSHALALLANPPNPHVSGYSRFQNPRSMFFICHECRDFCRGFGYHCKKCRINLDVKCALSAKPGNQIPAQADKRAEISHFSHTDHRLLLFKFTKEFNDLIGYGEYCSGCGAPFSSGEVYSCFDCEFYLHKNCAELPQEFHHPFHPDPEHPLSLEFKRYDQDMFICEECRDISEGFKASCKECDFKLDFKCALLVTNSGVVQRSRARKDLKMQIYHPSHLHILSLFNCKPMKGRGLLTTICDICESPMSNPAYCCLECEFHVHNSCAEMSETIKHPYHSHPLHSQFMKDSKGKCNACRRKNSGLVYWCHDCDFSLHSQCASSSLKVISPLKLDFHKHDLYYFVADHLPKVNFQCKVCGKKCRGSFYLCLECVSYFHLECIPIPTSVKPDYHMHRLDLKGRLFDYNESIKDYYCFACEKERSPNYHAYHCQECLLQAHVECLAFSEDVELDSDNDIGQQNESHQNTNTEYPAFAMPSPGQCRKQIETKDSSNNHPMICLNTKMNPLCYLCKLVITQVSGYTCKHCKVCFHKECAELPFKIKHSLHKPHPLTLVPADNHGPFICDGCNYFRDRESDVSYECKQCGFIIDLNCASVVGNQHQKPKQSSVSHFCHRHKLKLANFLENMKVSCNSCCLRIKDHAYCCAECKVFLHESCYDRPQIEEHPFHSEHHLQFGEKAYIGRCDVCETIIEGPSIMYFCDNCGVYIHAKCAQYLTSSLKHKSHQHYLFYFVAGDLSSEQKFECEKCGEDCDQSFYRCLECLFNFHLECLQIPKEVKSECHMHPLTLVDSFTEGGYKEFYCDDCESFKEPKTCSLLLQEVPLHGSYWMCD